ATSRARHVLLTLAWRRGAARRSAAGRAGGAPRRSQAVKQERQVPPPGVRGGVAGGVRGGGDSPGEKHEVAAGWEPVVEGPDRDARVPGDLLKRGVQALAVEHFARGGH